MKIIDFIPPIIFKVINRITRKNQSSIKLVYDGKAVESYSQYGEDLTIDSILNFKQKGFYIDIGANHPINLSNTKRFYDKGWRGINIEPNPILLENFNKTRPDDINLNVGIGQQIEKLDFYEFSLHEHSTFNKRIANRLVSTSNLKIVKEYKVDVWTLEKLFSDLVKGHAVDFMSIDTEGFEMEILKSNDWNKYRPYLIVIEMGDVHNEIYEFLLKIDYLPLSFNHVNAFFLDKRHLNK